MTPTATRTTPTTTDLVHAARNGDPRATRQLIDRYAGLVWSTVRSFRLRETDAQDAAQNTWLRMIEHLGDLRDADRIPGWLATTARRECLKIIREGRREVLGFDPELFDRPDERSPRPETVAVDRIMHALLWCRVAELPGPARHMVVTLTGPDAPRYGDFARASGIPIGSIGPQRMRYLRRLRRRLEASGWC